MFNPYPAVTPQWLHSIYNTYGLMHEVEYLACHVTYTGYCPPLPHETKASLTLCCTINCKIYSHILVQKKIMAFFNYSKYHHLGPNVINLLCYLTFSPPCQLYLKVENLKLWQILINHFGSFFPTRVLADGQIFPRGVYKWLCHKKSIRYPLLSCYSYIVMVTHICNHDIFR